MNLEALKLDLKYHIQGTNNSLITKYPAKCKNSVGRHVSATFNKNGHCHAIFWLKSAILCHNMMRGIWRYVPELEVSEVQHHC